MRKLTSILLDITSQETVGSLSRTVNNIQFDSRKVGKDDIFVAVRGTQADGHNYIEKAILLGASVIICEALPKNYTTN